MNDLEAKLNAYLDDELTLSERKQVESILSADAHARALLTELANARRLLAELPRERAPAEVYEYLETRLERTMLLAEQPATTQVAPHRRTPIFWSAAAVFALSIGLGWVVLNVISPPQSAPLALQAPSEQVPSPEALAAEPHADPQPTNSLASGTSATGGTSADAVPTATLVLPPQAKANPALTTPDPSLPSASRPAVLAATPATAAPVTAPATVEATSNDPTAAAPPQQAASPEQAASAEQTAVSLQTAAAQQADNSQNQQWVRQQLPEAESRMAGSPPAAVPDLGRAEATPANTFAAKSASEQPAPILEPSADTTLKAAIPHHNLAIPLIPPFLAPGLTLPMPKPAP